MYTIHKTKLTISGAPTPRMPLSCPRNMDRPVLELLLLAPLLLLPASVLLLLGVIATRKRPEPKNADEADADPTELVDIACLAGAKESMGLGRRRKVVTAARASPTRRRRAIVCNFFLNYWEIIWFGDQGMTLGKERRSRQGQEQSAMSKRCFISPSAVPILSRLSSST